MPTKRIKKLDGKPLKKRGDGTGRDDQDKTVPDKSTQLEASDPQKTKDNKLSFFVFFEDTTSLTQATAEIEWPYDPGSVIPLEDDSQDPGSQNCDDGQAGEPAPQPQHPIAEEQPVAQQQPAPAPEEPPVPAEPPAEQPVPQAEPVLPNDSEPGFNPRITIFEDPNTCNCILADFSNLSPDKRQKIIESWQEKKIDIRFKYYGLDNCQVTLNPRHFVESPNVIDTRDIRWVPLVGDNPTLCIVAGKIKVTRTPLTPDTYEKTTTQLQLFHNPKDTRQKIKEFLANPDRKSFFDYEDFRAALELAYLRNKL